MLVVHNFAPAAPLGQNYAEWSYDFKDGTPVYAFAHIAAYFEYHPKIGRVPRRRIEANKVLDRRSVRR